MIENVSDNKAMFAKDVLEDVLGYDTKQQNQKINVGTQNIENVKDKNETYIIEEEEEILR